MSGFFASWNEVAALFLSWVWQASWQGAIALSVAWLVTRGAWLPASFRCWVWRLAYAKLFLALFWLAPVELRVLEPIRPTVAPLSLRGSTESRFGPEQFPVFSGRVSPEAVVRPAATPPIWPSILCAVWVAGLMTITGRTLAGWSGLNRCRRQARPVTSPDVHAECKRLSDALGLGRVPELALTKEEGGPRVAGLLRPVILLPEHSLAEFSPERIKLLLAHELVHVRRGDLWWNWLALLVRAVFFFHPLVWLAQREWLLCQEMACDERAVEVTQAPVSEYGRLLVEVARSCSSRVDAGVTAAIMESKTALKERLMAMKQCVKLTRTGRVIATTCLFFVGGVGLVPWKLVAQTPPLAPLAPIGPIPKAASDPAAPGELPSPPEPPHAPRAPRPDPESKAHQAELRALHAAVEAAMGRLRIAEERLARVQALQAQQAVSLEQIELARSGVLESRAQLARSEADLAAHEEIDSKDQQILRLTHQIKQLQEQLAAKNVRSNRRGSPRAALGQQPLLEEEIALAELELAAYEASGTATIDVKLKVRRELVELRRQLAELEGNHLSKTIAILEEERQLLDEDLKRVEKRFELGQAPRSAVLSVRRRILALERERLETERLGSQLENETR